jgi:hypothetical protein
MSREIVTRRNCDVAGEHFLSQILYVPAQLTITTAFPGRKRSANLV